MSEKESVDYAGTLNLPKTSFKMKANLAQKEPLIIRDWNKKKFMKNLQKEINQHLYYMMGLRMQMEIFIQGMQ